MKQKILFILVGAIALAGLVSCESIYDIGREETDKSVGYQIISKNQVSAWFYDYETGKDVVVDSLDKSDWNLYLSGLQVFFCPISLEKKRYIYQENLRIPVKCEDGGERGIDVEIGGLDFSYTYDGKNYVMKPLQALYIDVGELEDYVDPASDADSDSDPDSDLDPDSASDAPEFQGSQEYEGEKRYSALFTLVAQDMFTHKDIILAQKRGYFQVRNLNQ